jgi:hypothetical protein
MAELVTPNTPRPSRYTDDRSIQGNLYERFKIEQAQQQQQQQSLQETRQQARERRHSMYKYKFILSTRKKGTSLRVCFNPVTCVAISALECNKDPVTREQITDIPHEDVSILIKALRSCRFLVDVTSSISPAVLKTVSVDAIRAHESARLELDNAMIPYRAGLVSEETYQELIFKHKMAGYWKDEIAAEMRRVNGMGMGHGISRNGNSEPQWPTQHARLSASTRTLLRNVLSKETLHRTFVSLASLSAKVSKEVADFLKMKNRDPDRKLVIQQIKDSFASMQSQSQSQSPMKTKSSASVKSA